MYFNYINLKGGRKKGKEQINQYKGLQMVKEDNLGGQTRD